MQVVNARSTTHHWVPSPEPALPRSQTTQAFALREQGPASGPDRRQRMAVGRGPVHVNPGRACATLGEGMNQGVALVVLDSVGQDVFGRLICQLALE